MNAFDRELLDNLENPEFAASFEENLRAIRATDEEVRGNHTPEGDFIEQDTANPHNYCKHGTFIGNPFGGDYLCHWCELGE